MPTALLASSWNDFLENAIEAIKNFFNPDLGGYTTLDIEGRVVSIHIIIWGIFAGLMIAAIYSAYTKNIPGNFVRQLIDQNAIEPENAKTLAELGFEKSAPVKLGLKGYTLNRVVKCTERDEFIKNTNAERESYEAARAAAKSEGKSMPAFKEPTFKVDSSKCHYYIAEKDRYTAEMRFNSRGSSFFTVFYVLFIGLLCVIIVYALLPHILRLLDLTLSKFTIEGNTHHRG